VSDIVTEFSLSRVQAARLKNWLSDTVYPAAIAFQRSEALSRGELWRRSAEPAWKDGKPYYGTAGLGLIYEFEQNALGNSVRVTEAITGQSLNLTDLDDW
jgi:hypothetical protein